MQTGRVPHILNNFFGRDYSVKYIRRIWTQNVKDSKKLSTNSAIDLSAEKRNLLQNCRLWASLKQKKGKTLECLFSIIYSEISNLTKVPLCLSIP